MCPRTRDKHRKTQENYQTISFCCLACNFDAADEPTDLSVLVYGIIMEWALIYGSFTRGSDMNSSRGPLYSNQVLRTLFNKQPVYVSFPVLLFPVFLFDCFSSDAFLIIDLNFIFRWVIYKLLQTSNYHNFLKSACKLV